MPRPKILFIDGHRHRLASGYGEFARGLLIALRAIEEIEVSIVAGAPEFEDIGRIKDALADVPILPSPFEADLIVQIGQPGARRRFPAPTILYTMFDTSHLELEKLEGMRTHAPDLVFVPNEYNRRFLAPHVRAVEVLPPRLDPSLFRPRRSATPAAGEFVFLFQGGFGFRKGVDLLLEAFLSEFRQGEARLHLHVPRMSIAHANLVLRALSGRTAAPVVEIYDKSYSREWMANFYNRADAFVSLTRAEAWGLPISEAILCGRPVVTSRDWAMAEYLPPDYPFFVEGERRLLGKNTNEFGRDWCLRHDAPGNTYFEADVADARRKLRAVFCDREGAEAEAMRARTFLIRNSAPTLVEAGLRRAIAQLLGSEQPTAVRVPG